jgi:CheY-like chemotaxis protein
MTGDSTGSSGGPGATTVLVVEDDPDVREAISEALADSGFRAVTATDGRDALSYLRKRGAARPSLILLDLMMPVMDGFQFRTEQRSDPEVAEIPIVVISASGDITQAASSMAAAGVLRKPVRLPDLLAMVRRFT